MYAHVHTDMYVHFEICTYMKKRKENNKIYERKMKTFNKDNTKQNYDEGSNYKKNGRQGNFGGKGKVL